MAHARWLGDIVKAGTDSYLTKLDFKIHSMQGVSHILHSTKLETGVQHSEYMVVWAAAGAHKCIVCEVQVYT